MNSPEQERRRFTRIHFDAECEVHYPGGAIVMQLVDISLRGVLLRFDHKLSLEIGGEAEVNIYLANDVLIRMKTQLNYAQPPNYGFFVKEIDLESMSHLRRLLELNLGDEALLERELEHMVED
ncbi:PilZ domain-containing protein [Nitrincola schmidtii]|uniref:PilZ domain-containing protein n=1 Tax=Nitrincola schmidtii TaxID=1730894 RepID=UPI00124C96E1|nr:PilZ domain-containing protein [Nitrincola schmidtii]